MTDFVDIAGEAVAGLVSACSHLNEPKIRARLLQEPKTLDELIDEWEALTDLVTSLVTTVRTECQRQLQDIDSKTVVAFPQSPRS
jgi:hypothetical protein